mgnify:CR=1 FL=1
MFRFEKLEVWKNAIQLADAIYRATKRFPDDERYGLTSQLRRAGVSIAANIAEGTGRSGSRERIRFVEIAYGSLMEVVSHLEIAMLQGFLEPDEHGALYARSEELARMLSGFRRSLEPST